MNYETISYEQDGTIGVITLNRPQALNAIDSLMAGELADALEEIDNSSELLAVAITGAGDQAFSVGLDIKELVVAAEGIDDLQVLDSIRRRLWSANPWEQLASLSKPSVAAIRGFALGGGLELALACDIRIASKDAKFGLPEVRLGIIPAHGGTQRLPRIIGRAKAIEMILTGDTIDAEEARRIELVSDVVPAEQLLPAANEIALKLAANAPIAVRFAREAVSKGLDVTLDQGLHLETDLYAILQTTEDRAEGIRSFAEKRKPKFSGM